MGGLSSPEYVMPPSAVAESQESKGTYCNVLLEVPAFCITRFAYLVFFDLWAGVRFGAWFGAGAIFCINSTRAEGGQRPQRLMV